MNFKSAAAQFLIVVMTICSSMALAQTDTTIMEGVEGNWSVRFSGDTVEGAASDFRISLYREREVICKEGELNGCLFEQRINAANDWTLEYSTPGANYANVQELSVDATGTQANIKHGYFIYGRWGGQEDARATSATSVDGDLAYDDKKATTHWERIVPDITDVIATNDKDTAHLSKYTKIGPRHVLLAFDWDKYHWGDQQNFPGQRPSFIIRAKGSGLWGRHFATFPFSRGIQAGNVYTKGDNGNEYLEFSVTFWPGVKSGRHFLNISGQTFVVDLKITGEPEPEGVIIIGAISVERASTSLTYQNLKAAVRNAKDDAENADEAFEHAHQRLQAAVQDSSAILTPLYDADQAMSTKLYELQAKGRKDTETVVQLPEYAKIGEAIARHQNRLDVLKNAAKNVEATEAKTPHGKARLEELAAERETVESKITTLEKTRDALFTPERTPAELTAIQNLKSEIADTRADIERREKIYQDRIARAEGPITQLRSSRQTAYAKLDAARKKLVDWERNSGLLQITGLTTRHATYEPAEADEIETLYDLTADVYEELAKHEGVQQQLAANRDQAREQMLAAAQAAEDANNRLETYGNLSLIAQAATEAVDSFYSIAKVAELGPGAVIAEASRQMLFNTVLPPTYYDSTRMRLSDYTAHGSRLSRLKNNYQVIDTDAWAAGLPAASTVRNFWLNLPYKIVIQHLQHAKASGAMKTASYRMANAINGRNSSPIANAGVWKRYLRAVAEKDRALTNAAKELADVTGREGMRGIVRSYVKDIGFSLARGLGKEALKRAQAEFIEGGALEDYMLAQVELGRAVARVQHASDKYWVNKDSIDILRPMYEGLSQRHDAGLDLVETRNEPFNAEAGYLVELTIKGQETNDLQNMKADLYLGGQLLTRADKSGALAWRIPESAAEHFKQMAQADGGPVELPVQLKVE